LFEKKAGRWLPADELFETGTELAAGARPWSRLSRQSQPAT